MSSESDSTTLSGSKSIDAAVGRGFWVRCGDQFGLQLVREYLIPAETNNFWYSLGGILGISLAAEFLTGFILLFKYVPDAGLAFGITQSLLNSPTWKIVLNFHYWNSFLIFGLLMLHMMRVFISGAYRGNKIGLWFVGIFLAGLIFVAYITGEALHWDEVGFAVPWHTSEFFQAIGMENFFQYTFADLLSIPSATVKLVQLYGVHVGIIPVLIALAIVLHFYLIKEKGTSLPFWKTATGRKEPFSEHIKMWFIWSVLMLGSVLLISAFVPRDAGIAPQLLPTSPLYGAEGGPGKLGAIPTFPISWTHGMNVFVAEYLGIEPNIWGTVIGMVLMLGALVAVPFADKGKREPLSSGEAFDWKRRWLAFACIALFWIIFIIGVVQNYTAHEG